MKHAFFATYVFCLLSCTGPENETTRRFIPGQYVRDVQNEFSTGRDTLIITPLSETAYHIEHHMTYQRILDSVKQKPESKVEHSSALLDENEGILIEQKRGRRLLFQPSKNLLWVGGSPYQKLIH